MWHDDRDSYLKAVDCRKCSLAGRELIGYYVEGPEARSVREELLTDELWERMERHVPRPGRSKRGGRPPAEDPDVVEGMLSIVWSGGRWKDLPGEVPRPSTWWRRLRVWEEQGVWLRIWRE